MALRRLLYALAWSQFHGVSGGGRQMLLWRVPRADSWRRLASRSDRHSDRRQPTVSRVTHNPACALVLTHGQTPCNCIPWAPTKADIDAEARRIHRCPERYDGPCWGATREDREQAVRNLRVVHETERDAWGICENPLHDPKPQEWHPRNQNCIDWHPGTDRVQDP